MSHLVVLAAFLVPADSRLPGAKPDEVGMDGARLARIDAAVAQAIAESRCPGAVVLVARHGKVALRKAYGLRAKLPREEPMTADTVFDLASLTKPIATASAVMLLVERGKLRLDDRVAKHLPDFGKHGKEKITVEQLLLHTSGLIADNSLADYREGREKATGRIHDLRLTTEPGARFIYSDVGFIVLGELVAKLGGEPLDTFAHKNIFDPLGMTNTSFQPDADRCAPTEKDAGRWLRGVVHDPRARLMGGVAGHAGLFGTADDLAVYAQMLLDGGARGERRVIQEGTVRQMVAPLPVPGGRRSLGWDVRTGFSGSRGDHFAGFGHTGFTGTSLWIDPTSQTVVIILSNRVHPEGKGDVSRLRSRVATLAAEAIIRPPFPTWRAR
jgi:CubicO group peptidase (beta-lactamase class C family)